MIYILLPVHNRLDETRKFVSCLKIQTCREYHLVLIDDGCIDGTPDYVEREIDNLTVLRGNGNLWWAGSLEKARKHLLQRRDVRDDDIVLIANDDIMFNEEFLNNVLRDVRENPSAIILAQCNERDTDKVIDRGVVVNWKRLEFRQAENINDINVLSTRGLYMTVDVFKRVGRFHPFLLPHYASDYEFTHRGYKKGIQLRVSNRNVVYGNLKTTGERYVDYNLKIGKLFYNFFISKKSVYNRITWTNFILLSCAPKYIPINLLRIHIGFLVILGKWFINRIRDYMLQIHVLLDRTFTKKIQIIICSGGMKQRHWIATEQTQIDLTNRQSWLKFFSPGTIDSIMAEHVWEHLSTEEAKLAVQNCKEFLKSGGYLRIAVPDGYCPDVEYIDQVKPMGSGIGSEDHKVLYNYKSLSNLFCSNGYDVKILEHWDDNGVFHYKPWNIDGGLIRQSKNHDPRNRDGKLKYTSLIMDVIKK